MAREFFPYLAIGRFIAAFGVLIFHMSPRIAELHPPDWLLIVARNGFLGVSFFFVLSGFLLGKVYQPGVLPFKDFIRARWLRIFPTYLLFVLPYVLEQCLHISRDPSAKPILDLVLPLLLVQVWFPGFSQTLMGPAWTLACEMFFYTLFPWMKAKANQRSLFWLVFWLVFSQVAPLIEFLTMGAVTPARAPELGYFFATFPLVYLASFALGVCAAGFSFSEHLAKFAILVGSVWLVLICLLPVASLYKLSSGIAPPMVLIVAGLSKIPAQGKASKLMNFGVLLGDSSFVLYLFHRFAQRVAAQVFTRPSTMALLIEIVVIIGVSVVLHLKVEKWLIRKFKPTLNVSRSAAY